ncbi:energy transducer TonB [Hymenobacter roseosalivarius]|nr:energy transducer TonB [Hymenobacter roseosalivarius]
MALPILLINQLKGAIRMKAIILVLSTFLLCSTRTQAQKRIKSKVPPPYAKLEQGATSTDGKRIGKWNFYNSQEQLELTFDYDSSRISFTREDTTRYWVRADEQWQLKRLARAPRPIGSMDKRMLDLISTLRYPVSALARKLQGTVVVSYTVTPTGQTADFTIESSMSPECDREVFQRLQALPDNWIPAIYRGRPTTSRFYLSVRFEMIEGEEARRRLAELKLHSDNPDTSPEKQSVTALTPYAHKLVVTALGVERR